jgi:hypothetical protein
LSLDLHPTIVRTSQFQRVRKACGLSAACRRAPVSPTPKRVRHRQALGRSRGGLSTKIHLKTDLDGNPLDCRLTGGEASDSTQFETSLDTGPDICPCVALTDKGYDSQANRAAVRERGITPIIPRRENANQRGRFFFQKRLISKRSAPR